jgi:signal transduction histidine kinase/HAMP domain-containing protein/ActR/RegA family two-component response regulator
MPHTAPVSAAEVRYSDSDLKPIVDALAALANGDFRARARRFSDGARGDSAMLAEIGALIDEIAAQLSSLTSEVAQKAEQVRDIAVVTTAVARGDLTRKVTVDAQGEMLQLKQTFNTMVDQLSAFADEVTRVAREVGTEGRLGGQAHVRGVSGVWEALTDSVNGMARNLTVQVRNISQVATAVAEGDLSQKITVDVQGEVLQLKQTMNTMVDQLSAFADEVTRVAREVGTEGRLGGQAQVRGVSGIWKDLTDNVNSMASNLTTQVRNIAQVTTAVALGDLTKKIDVDARGEILEMKTTINTMVDQLSAFADEVTRVAREVGTEGRLGGQAEVEGVSGTWKRLTESVNGLASNLTTQVRAIAAVASAVAEGDLTQSISVSARGEVAELKDNINLMVANLRETTLTNREQDWLNTNLARISGLMQGHRDPLEVARLIMSELTPLASAQYGAFYLATPPGSDLPRRVSGLRRQIEAGNGQNAAGDADRRGKPDHGTAAGPLDAANGPNGPNGPNGLNGRGETAGSEANGTGAHREEPGAAADGTAAHGNAGKADGPSGNGAGADAKAAVAVTGQPELEFIRIATYGFQQGGLSRFMLGEGMAGQAALDRKRILIEDVPPGYLTVGSGLGVASPVNVVMLPILFEAQVLGVLELASLHEFSDVHLAFFDQFVPTIGVTINTIMANARTESLLTESQRLATQLQERTEELQRQQAELRRSNAELEEKAALMAKQNRAIEVQNFQIEQARRTLEERAQQLATSSRYKSEFLANMSHELRTPLNSLLVLAGLLSENPDGNLSSKQVEFATTIHESGSDLLRLINDILDLSKVEAGKMDVHPAEIPLDGLVEYLDATFRPMAAEKGLTFEVETSLSLPPMIYSDEQRLQQVLRNLLSNAVKFTAKGGVRLRVAPAEDVTFTGPLRDEPAVIAFSVADTGIGISEEKQHLIFEAFQQADGTTSRRYGGTGLGLSISKDIARLLGGEIKAASRLGHGSTFTLYLPARSLRFGSGKPPRRPAEQALADSRPAAITADDPGGHRDSGTASGRIGQKVPGPSDDSALSAAPDPHDPLNSAKILIVDDDVRNVFALTSVFERCGAEVLYAENGREGIEALERNEDVRLVLMDIMMPELDGYATTEAIRNMPQFADLPIIAVTAKAMKGDREKSIASGATDYITKPVDTGHLLAVMRTCLERAVAR